MSVKKKDFFSDVLIDDDHKTTTSEIEIVTLDDTVDSTTQGENSNFVTTQVDTVSSSESIDLFGDSINKEHKFSKPERDFGREAKIKMTREEYQQRLEELNENAENKHYILFFGTPNSGKSYIIASLIHYMNQCLSGTVRLNPERTTTKDELLFNQMLEMFRDHQKRLSRTATLDFYELNVIFEPKDLNLPMVEMSFIDASGENFNRALVGEREGQVGELPDSIDVILDSNVNCKFAFVYDQSQRKQDRDADRASPQVSVLRSLYDHVLELQSQKRKRFPKILLLSKADKISDETRKKYNDSAQAYALAEENELRGFANGFFNEANTNNRIIFYRMGRFTKHDDITDFDEECPSRLFDWLYSSITGKLTRPQLSWWQRFVNWLLGRD